MVTNAAYTAYRSNGWQFNDSAFDTQNDYERSFIELELGTYKTLDFYKSRLKTIGFEKMDHVLDAGCGIGQWAIALAALNTKVSGIDLMPSRVETAKHMAQTMGTQNAVFEVGGLEKLPYADGTFDGIFCYGVFMFTDIEKTLAEFNRVLKPGGKIYLNFNAPGWYAHLILDRGFKKKNFTMVRQATRMVVRYMIGKTSQILIREEWLKKRMAKHGFMDLSFASEGCLTPYLPANAEKPKSIYQSHFYGMRAIIEVLGRKGA